MSGTTELESIIQRNDTVSVVIDGCRVLINLSDVAMMSYNDGKLCVKTMNGTYRSHVMPKETAQEILNIYRGHTTGRPF